MAKLSAHGYELLRIRWEYFLFGSKQVPADYVPTPDEQAAHSYDKLVKHFEERSYRSDGKILSKSGFWSEATPY